MRLVFVVVLAALVTTAGAVQSDDLQEEANQIFKPLPMTTPDIAGNPSNKAKVKLGEMLFFEPRLSKSGTISCNSCHNLGTGGADNLPVSIGHGWQHGRRNAPTVLNSVFNIAQFWDGRARDLKSQAKQPVQTSVEMNNTPDRVVKTLKSIPEYIELFAKAFPDEEDPVSFENMARAIEVFEATLITANGPFDRFLRGENDAMSVQQRRGLKKFIGKGCTTCHRGINVGGNAFFPFGMMRTPDARVRPPEDEGRSQVTGRALLHRYFFRVAPLRNVTLTAPYFHSGRVWDLGEAVRIMAKSQLSAPLSDEEVEDIVAFLGALTGEQPHGVYPKLPPSTSSTPRPEP